MFLELINKVFFDVKVEFLEVHLIYFKIDFFNFVDIIVPPFVLDEFQLVPLNIMHY